MATFICNGAKISRNANLCKSLSRIQENTLFSWSSSKKFGQFSAIEDVGIICPSVPVPDNIQKPLYYKTQMSCLAPSQPEIKSQEQINKMRKSCMIAREVLSQIIQKVEEGITTEELDKIASQLIFEKNAYPSPRNYRGFPKNICTSVNNVACHGIPDDRKLQNGDLISIDCTVYYDGYHGDCCETIGVGDVDSKGDHLLVVAKQCRDSGIDVCGPGVSFNKIGQAIERLAKEEGLSVVPCFTGHGIGTYFHGPPDIYHFDYGITEKMKPGMTFTVEPVICQGSGEIEIHSDGWTAFVYDGGRAVQFEHTILITENGCEMLTAY